MYVRVNATNAEIEELERLTTLLIKERQNLERPNYSGDGFIWPLEERFQKITDHFGWTTSFGGRNHGGTDIGNAGINGASIYAIQSGTVIRAVESSSNSGYGSHVIIDHGGGVASLYSHMIFGSVTVSERQDVVVGQVIGKVGSTGFSTGPHLHFEIHVNGVRVNPMGFNYTFMY
ncbi:MAG: M23 family metallopeptidase [Oscillospiraceae bacterium]|nr:M23 family metallopeptidase [Oscillospiraceae bacterium]